MAQRRFHYEQAFEHYLRTNRVPYVAVDEARKALLPSDQAQCAIKSFDFVVYAARGNLLVDVKGRMYGPPDRRGRRGGGGHFQSWVTRDDVEGLAHWQRLFGDGFEAVFVFAYCLRRQPPDALFEEVFEHAGRWYALREARLADYCRQMTDRSARWQTVHVPADAFGRISRPFSVRRLMSARAGCGPSPTAIS